MITVETIRDLIYKEEKDILLHMYRSITLARSAGAPVDNAGIEMLQKHLTNYMPNWLAEGPEFAQGFYGYFDFESCVELGDRNPKLLRFVELIYRNMNGGEDFVNYCYGRMSVARSNIPGLPDPFTHLYIDFYTEVATFSFRTVDRGVARGNSYPSDYVFCGNKLSIREEDPMYCEPTPKELTNLIGYVNHAVGVPGYFDEEGCVTL